MTEVQLKPAAHRQTRYRAAPRLDPPEVLPIPAVTGDLQRAIEDLSTHGVCLLEGALHQDEIDHLRERVGNQGKQSGILREHPTKLDRRLLAGRTIAVGQKVERLLAG